MLTFSKDLCLLSIFIIQQRYRDTYLGLWRHNLCEVGSVEDQYGFQPLILVSNVKGLGYSDTNQPLLISGRGPCLSNNFYIVFVNSLAKQRKKHVFSIFWKMGNLKTS